jgi:hypothetical protein
MPRDRTTSQTLALLFGVVFLLVGIAGFIPGITTNYDELKFASPDSEAKLLGFIQISILHNIVHGLFGIGILAARKPSTARTYLLGAGLIYAVLFVYGLFVGNDDDANFVPISNIDDWAIHLPLAIALLGAWFATKKEEMDTHRATAAP